MIGDEVARPLVALEGRDLPLGQDASRAVGVQAGAVTQDPLLHVRQGIEQLGGDLRRHMREPRQG